MVAAVVLAAGAATRFGSPKQRLLLAGVVERVRRSSVDDVLVVTGAHEVETDARTIRCDDWQRGPGASLRCGLAVLGRDVEAAVVVLADGPRLAPAAIDRVVEAWRAGAGPIVAATYDSVRGHPVVLARSTWPDVPDDGARALPAAFVGCDDLGAPGDVDEPPTHDVDEIDRHGRSLLDAGTSRSSWQLRDGDARLILRGAPGAAEPTTVDVLAAQDAATATGLLLRAAEAVGARRLSYVVDDPPRFGADATFDVALARACGFVLVRETNRWQRGADPVDMPERLAFEPCSDEEFFSAMGLTLAETRDRALRRLAETAGPAGAARSAMEGLRRGPLAWEIARDDAGELAGVSAPALVGERHAVIGYVGVAPDQRGRGYAVDLLAHATRRLVDAGLTPVVADTDIENPAIASAFQRLGYARFGRRSDLELELVGGPGEMRR
jgi:CTP:molybdopterin cytidylyltransferase MocA/ribosomal protein S18 acetylase RimI-like enzyme